MTWDSRRVSELLSLVSPTEAQTTPMHSSCYLCHSTHFYLILY